MQRLEKEKVERILKFYRTIPDEIKLYREKRAEIEDCYNPITGIKTYEDLAMPRGLKIADQTAIAVSRLKGHEAELIREIDEYISNLERVATETFSILKKLPYYEKMTVYRFYLDGWSWVKVSFELRYSEKQCMRLRDVALQKLGEMFENNKVIMSFNYPK